MSSQPCPSSQTLAAFAAGQVSATELDGIAEHLEQCASCQGTLAELDGRTVSLVDALRRGGPEPSTKPMGPSAGSARIEIGVVGVGPLEELRALLRRRLLVVSGVAFVAGLGLGLSVLLDRYDAVGSAGNRKGGDLVLAALMIHGLFSLIYLLTHPGASIAVLRRIEIGHLIVTAAIAFSLRWTTFAATDDMTFSSDAHRVVFIEQAVLLGNLCWYTIIVGYGVLIPNTAKRAAIVTAALAIAAVASVSLAGNPFPKTHDRLVAMSGLTTVGVLISGAIGVFGSYRISTLQQEVFAARDLGPYKLVRKLGAGGMGEVYLAEHRLLKRPCAVKLIRSDQARDARLLQRFEREVQATARLTHPNTVEVFDYGRTEDGTFYYVMEYLPGSTLADLVRDSGPLPPDRVVGYLRQLCGALAEAHAAGLVHRDIKPGNVMICERGGTSEVVKLLDFGLVHEPEADNGLTREGVAVGTPAYMSPEQAEAGRVDRRSDVYSLGALAYFLLTGRPPYVAGSVLEIMIKQRQEPPVPLSEHVPNLPEDLEAAVLRCLAKAPQDRYQDMDAFDEALAACRRASGQSRQGA